ncbi:DUF2778 domain-containing protein [Paraburkholderia sp. MMS20-SJTN17]|uniref:DUF2778 domain-containing protein n=1 Tax=Paraburkholderia translucens TaxID=2886945 RepID=A0ABS8K7X0_9BURK|nr:tlde1 domain-containing protein [Paraburkholderia sp. MMS20-SJTN17]MCC8400846.1 DUF2778 domain-containing protein [Paraburkholderia sp. MMS20-SJTN17]
MLVYTGGYSGRGKGKDNHDMQYVRDIGPIPVGEYTIGAPFRHDHTGPYSMRLTPINGTNTHGRAGFMIHGDSIKEPGNASNGCIVLDPTIRMRIWNSGDRLLKVVHP